jgi:hypothetical protein
MENDQFEIERVIKHRDVNLKYNKKAAKHSLKREYLIKWRGFDNSNNTWEPYSQICEDAPEAVEEYEGERKLKRMQKLKVDLANALFDDKSNNTSECLKLDDGVELNYVPENMKYSNFMSILLSDDPRKRVLKNRNKEAMSQSQDIISSQNSFENLTEEKK